MRRTVAILSAVALAIAVVMLWPFTAHLGDSAINGVDPLFYAWNLAHNTTAFFNGFAKLLDTNIFYPTGNTLAFSDTLYAQTLFTAPVIILTGNPLLAENLYVIATFPLSAVTMYLLAKRLVRNDIAAAVSGLLFAFSYPRLAQIGHISVISSMWLPLFVLSLIAFMEDEAHKTRNLLLTMLWFLLCLNSTMYFAVFAGPVAFVVIAFRLAGTRVKNALAILRPRLKLLALLALPFAVVAIVSVFPYVRLKIEYPGIHRRLTDASLFKAHVIDYVSVLPTSVLARVGMPININEHALYPTLTLMVLAVYGYMKAPSGKRKSAMLFGCVALLSFLFSLGPDQELRIGSFRTESIPMPYAFLYYAFPPAQIIRVPARFSIFVVLGLAALAAIGLERLMEHRKRKTIVAVVVLALFLLEAWQIGTPSVPSPTVATLPEYVRWFKALPDTAVIAEAPLMPVGKSDPMEQQLYVPYGNLTESNVYALEAMRTYLSSFHGKRMVNGYSGFFPDNYHAVADEVESFPSDDAWYILKSRGVSYIVVHEQQYGDRWNAIRTALEHAPGFRLAARFGPDRIYEVLKEYPQ